MSSSSSKKSFLQENLQIFSDQLQSAMPLEHLSQHHEEAVLRAYALQQADQACVEFIKKMEASKIPLNERGDLLKQICSSFEQLIEEYLKKNTNFKKEYESLLRKRIGEICEDFRLSLEAKAIANPDMDLKSVEEFFDKGKMHSMTFFEHLWKHGNGNDAVFQEQKKTLQTKLDNLKKEMLQKHKTKSDEKTKKCLKEVSQMLEMTKKVRGDIGALQGTLIKSKHTFKENFLRIRNCDNLVGNDKILNEKYMDLRVEMLEIMVDTKMSLESFDDLKGRNQPLRSQPQPPASELAVPNIDNRNKQKRKGAKITVTAVPEPTHPTDALGKEERTEVAPKISVVLETKKTNADDKIKEKKSESDLARKTNGFKARPDGILEVEVNGDMARRLRQRITLTQTQKEQSTSHWRNVVEAVVLADSKASIQVKENVEVGGVKHEKKLMNTISTFTPCISKTPKLSLRNLCKVDPNDLNTPDQHGDFLLLRAIRDGESLEIVKRLLSDGANVNVKTANGESDNAGHAVIDSLKNKAMTHEHALKVLNLLMENGFTSLNEGDILGMTPLHQAMQYQGLNEELLTWFYENGADFNSVDKQFGDSILFHAISNRRGAEIINKILDFGGNLRFVNKWKVNALHLAAQYAHEEALEIFLEKLDVNEVNTDKITPLHLLFLREELDYGNCLKMLVEMGAQFGMPSQIGHVPLVTWIKYGNWNVFVTLTKTMDILPITEEIASAALTAIVQEMEKKEKFFPSSPEKNEFVSFLLFLIEDKNAKLRLKDEPAWKVLKWGKLDKVICTKNFFKELKATGRMKCKGEFVRVTAKCLGEIEFHSKSGSDSVPIEAILDCLLTCRKYQGFVEVCRFVENFCDEPIVSKKSCNGYRN